MIGKFIPVFEPMPFAFRDHQAMHMPTPPLKVEPYDVNHVRLIVDESARIVDGVALCNAVNDMLALARRRRS